MSFSHLLRMIVRLAAVAVLLAVAGAGPDIRASATKRLGLVSPSADSGAPSSAWRWASSAMTWATWPCHNHVIQGTYTGQPSANLRPAVAAANRYDNIWMKSMIGVHEPKNRRQIAHLLSEPSPTKARRRPPSRPAVRAA